MGDDPYAGMTDEQLLARALAALRFVKASPLDSVQRLRHWAAYDSAHKELERRLVNHVSEKLRER